MSALPLFAAGALLGLATLLRYQVGVLLPVVAVLVAIRQGARAAVVVVAGMVFLLLLGGVYDWVTWGTPFQAMVGYLRFNLIGSGANQWGVDESSFYLRSMMKTNGPFVLLLLVGLVAGFSRTWPVAILALTFFVVHSAIPHKELRFLLPVQPLLLLCAAVGLAALLARLPLSLRKRLVATHGLALVLVVAFAVRARGVTFADIGQRILSPKAGGPTSTLVWGAFAERNRLFVEAGERADLCGLAAPYMNPYFTGGYTYLHRCVPLLWGGEGADLAAANYLILGPGRSLTGDRYRQIDSAGGYVLYRRDKGCAAPPPKAGQFDGLLPAGVPGP